MEMRKPSGVSLSLILINMASIMERADESFLPSVYKEVSLAFNIGPTELGYLTFIRIMTQSLLSPAAGVLVLRYDRPKVITIGILCWAISMAATGISSYYYQVAVLRAFNGFGLGIVIPALQSFIADGYHDDSRGTGFGWLYLVGSVGGMGGGAVATVMAGHRFLGLPGWRCAFILMGILSSLIGLLVYAFVVDPRTASSDLSSDISERSDLIEKAPAASPSVWHDSWLAMKSILKLKTFQVIVLQGFVGSVPWSAMVFFTMWFELIGFGHESTAGMLSVFTVGTALGSLLGGYLADKLSKLYPYSGRVFLAQLSAFMSVPYSWFLLSVIPQKVTSWFLYCSTLFFMGLSISWCGSCANGPIFAQVVPPKDRTMIYAFDRAFEGSLAAFAAPIVGILAEKLYGYDSNAVKLDTGSAQNALALSKGLLLMMAIPWGLCSLFYGLLHFTVRHDFADAKVAVLKEQELT